MKNIIISQKDSFKLLTVLVIEDQEENGPFHCGLNGLFNIGSFAIYLKGPYSTSKDIEIATNFATNDGLILSIQNDTLPSQFQSVFNCSWISAYSEENERLFIYGECRLRLETITIIPTAQNFQQWFHALYIFDAMISAQSLDAGILQNINILSSDILIVRKLLGYSLNMLSVKKKSEFLEEVDGYIINNWQIYLNQKTQIKINMSMLDYHYGSLSDLIIYSIKEAKEYDKIDDGDLLNVLNTKICKIFPKLNQIVIHTTSYTGKYEHRFNLLSFLSSIQAAKSCIKYVIKAWRKYDYGIYSGSTWLNGISIGRIEKQYNEKKWNITTSKEMYQKDGQHIADILIINK